MAFVIRGESGVLVLALDADPFPVAELERESAIELSIRVVQSPCFFGARTTTTAMDTYPKR